MDGRENLSQDERCDGHVDDSRVLEAASWISAEIHEEHLDYRRRIMTLCQRLGDLYVVGNDGGVAVFGCFTYPLELTPILEDRCLDAIEEALDGVIYIHEGLYVADAIKVRSTVSIRGLLRNSVNLWRPRIVSFHRDGRFRQLRPFYGGNP